MNAVIKVILIILISSVKFVAGPPFARYFDSNINFNYFETVMYCIIGGMLGVYVFTNFAPVVFRFWYYIKKRIMKIFRKKDFFDDPTADINQKVEIKYEYIDADHSHEAFSKRYPKAIKIWNKYGLAGIAFLTPIIISIPIGSIVAARLVDKKKKIFLYMFVSILFWSLVMNKFWRMGSHSETKTVIIESVKKP